MKLDGSLRARPGQREFSPTSRPLALNICWAALQFAEGVDALDRKEAKTLLDATGVMPVEYLPISEFAPNRTQSAAAEIRRS
jgi:hypothetical protein